MILIDLNQLMISNIIKHLKDDTLENENLIRHKIIKRILSVKRKFGQKYGKIVICCDSRSYWRREFFPNYKMHRREERTKSDLDWDRIHAFFNIFRDEIKANLPYAVIDVEGSEADDVIAVLVQKYHVHENILIYSSDKDFMQLQKYANVDQYSPVDKIFVYPHNPYTFLKEHILRGDKGDGVPNILSDDNCIIEKRVQKRITKKAMDGWINSEMNFVGELKNNFDRNKKLIDLNEIPNELKEKINVAYTDYKFNPKNKLIGYFMTHKLDKLFERATEF